MQLHHCNWEKDIELNPYFTLHKTKVSLIDYATDNPINLIYFDAFAASAQPELWTKEIFEKLFSMLAANAVLVTYSSKGSVRRAMLEAGFSVEKIPGALHKREMIRARKIPGTR